MSKLLFIFERDMPTVSITRDVFTHLDNYPDINPTFKYLSDIVPNDIDTHDVIIFIRPNNLYCNKIAENARKAGHLVVTFCDDDLLNLPKTVPTMPWRKKGLQKTLANSDVIWSCSRHILKKYKDLTAGKRTAISDTIVRPDELEGINKTENNTIKIVYAAAPSHADLFDKYIAPTIPELVKEFEDKISLTFISVHPQVSGIQCEYIPGMPLLTYRKYMKDNHFDIGLAPLNNDEFSKCKYFNKFLEYTTQGVVGIYTNMEPYTQVVRDRFNGFLADNSTESWLNALRLAIKNQQERKACLDHAIEHIKKNHSEKAVIEQIRRGIPEILEIKGDYSKCRTFGAAKIKYYCMRLLDWLYLVGFYIKNAGFSAVIKRTRRHFTDAKSYKKRVND